MVRLNCSVYFTSMPTRCRLPSARIVITAASKTDRSPSRSTAGRQTHSITSTATACGSRNARTTSSPRSLAALSSPKIENAIGMLESMLRASRALSIVPPDACTMSARSMAYRAASSVRKLSSGLSTTSRSASRLPSGRLPPLTRYSPYSALSTCSRYHDWSKR